MRNSKFYFDWNNPDGGIFLTVREILISKKTKFQQVDIIDFNLYGLSLVIDGKIQVTEADEFIYHEVLVHPVMLAHPEPRKIFLLGGGDGAALREILKHKTVKGVVMVELDEEVVELAKRYLGRIHHDSFDDPRVEIHFEDGREFIKNINEKFDIVIIDCTDPLEIGTSHLLFTKQFFEIVKEHLSNNGIAVVQSNSTGATPREMTFFLTLRKTFERVFHYVSTLTAYIPSFACEWCFNIGSEKINVEKISKDDFNRRAENRLDGKLRYLDGAVFRKAVTLPKYIKETLKSWKLTIEDEKPLFVY